MQKGPKKVIALVQKEHPEIGVFRIRRVYANAGFPLNQKPPAIKVQAARYLIPMCPKTNEEWDIDLMGYALENGRRIRAFNVIDHNSRFLIASNISTSMPANMIIEYIENAIEMFGKPTSIRTDNGPKFSSKQFQRWIKWEQIQPR